MRTRKGYLHQSPSLREALVQQRLLALAQGQPTSSASAEAAALLAEEAGADAQMHHMLAEAERSGWSEDNSPRRRSDGSRFDEWKCIYEY